jgi:hypothetical protein
VIDVDGIKDGNNWISIKPEGGNPKARESPAMFYD